MNGRADARVLIDAVTAAGGDPRKGAVGDVAFEWDGPPRSFVLLTRGSLRVSFRTRGRQVPWAECRALGGQDCMPVSAAILARSELAVRAVCLKPSAWLVLPPEDFRRMVSEDVAFRRALFRQHASRLPAFFARTTGGMSIDQRLAKWLLDRPLDIRIEVTHQRIASDLLTAREVVSRTLKRFGDKGWIEQGRGWIEVLCPAALAQLALLSPGPACRDGNAASQPAGRPAS